MNHGSRTSRKRPKTTAKCGDRYRLARIGYIALYISLISVFFTPNSHAENATQPEPLRLYLRSSQPFENAGYYAAQMMGYFQRAGLEVEFIQNSPGRTASDVILGGEADFAITDSSVLVQQSKGKSVLIIAAIFQHSPQIFLSLEKSGIRNVHDMEGKRLMFSRVENSSLYAMLKQAGLKDTQYIYIDKQPEIADLLSGKADAIAADLGNEPDLLDRAGYQHYIIDPASYGLDFYGDMLITSSAMLAKKRPQVMAFRRATLEGWQYAMDHPEKVIDYILSKPDTHASRQHLFYQARNIRLAIAPSLVKIGTIDSRRIESITANFKKFGIIADEFDPSETYLPVVQNSVWLERLIIIVITLILAAIFSMLISRYRGKLRQKKFNKTIGEANDLFSATFDKSPLMMAIVLMPDCKITLINDAMLSTLGFRREEAVGMSTQSIGIVDDEVKLTSFAQLEEFGQSSMDIIFNTRSGDQRSGRLSANLIKYKTYSAALLIIEDTTDYIHAQEALRSSELRFRTIFDYSFSGIALSDNNGKILTTNAAFAKIIDYDRDDLVGMSFREFSFPDDIPEEEKFLEKIRNGEIEHYQYKKRLVRKDGSLAWIEIAVRVIRDEEDQPYRFVGVVNDISAKLKSENDNLKLQRQLQQTQKMEAIGQLTGGIAHDFNNFLASILGFAELSRTLYSDSIPKKLDDYLVEIINVGQRARNVVEQLLLFSRGNTHDAQIMDPLPIIQQSLQLLRSTLPSTVDLIVNLEVGNKKIYTSPMQLNQVLLNLALNAKRAINDSGKILIHAKQVNIVHSTCDSCHKDIDGEYLSIEVCDTGPGIAPVMIPRIFEPFFTTNDMGEGSGLGLAMVHGIVHSSKGHIRIYPSETGGACVQLLFPLQIQSNNGIEESQAKYISSHEAIRGKHILVIDDELPITDLMQEILGIEDYRVSVFNDPRQALQAFRSNPDDYDLLLTDQTMPGMNGTELAATIRELRPDIPVILSTGYSNIVRPENMSEFEIDRLLYKPINNKQLLNTVAELLSARPA